MRPFTRTQRLQFSASQSVGHRHFLTSNTFGFVDPLYSNGLINTFETVFVGANLLLSALGVQQGPVASGDFSAAAFAPLEALHRAQWAQADKVISSAYTAMGSFDTWNAWTQVWLGQVLFQDIWLQRACFQYFRSGDPRDFHALQDGTRPGTPSPLTKQQLALLDNVHARLDDFSSGQATAERASGEIMALLRAQDWLPKHVYSWGDRTERHADFAQPETVGKLLTWGFTDAPEPLRQGLFDFERPDAA